MWTLAPGVSGSGVKPRIVRSYDGGDIVLNREQGIVLSPAVFPELADYAGQDLVVTDGTTLLGADDKAGVAEIMDMAASFLLHPERPHGEIRIAFTPDEEIGRGADAFDVERFGADFAYTVDGGALGEIEYENFNAASAVATVRGTGIHPGSAKGRMLNACLVLMEFQGMLPAFQNPAFTEGYEGFYHLDSFRGDVERAVGEYLIRDHDTAEFERKKEFMQECAALLNRKYGGRNRAGGGKGLLLQHEGKNPPAHAPGGTCPQGDGGRGRGAGNHPGARRYGWSPSFLHGAAVSQPVRRRPQLPRKV